MRKIRLALAAFIGSVIFIAGAALAAPVLYLSGWSASAGRPETFTISRISGNGTATVVFQTHDGTAAAGVDYTATTQTLLWKQGQTKLTVTVPTLVNPAKAGKTISFTATITSNGITKTATGTIVEPAAPPPAVTWTKCADEGGKCYTTGNVRYGSDPTWTAPRAVNGSIDCSNATFGDPLVGTVKQCQTDGQVGSPPPPPATQTCPDGSVIPATSTCPVAPPPPSNSWVAAPLHDDGFARVKANPDPWDNVGANSRPLVAGELVAIFANGWGADYAGRIVYEVMALSDGTMGRAYASDLDGVAPVGTPPQLPADWWHPALVTANKTCPGAFGGPGVTQGGIYRAEILVGTHTSLASGQTGSAGATWTVYAADDPWQGARVNVTGDCLTGN
jgi:hypothetical protein